MKCCVAYTAVCNGKLTTSFAARFVASWMQHPPGEDTDLLVICNGGPLTHEQAVLFSALKPKFFPRSNEGWDIGGYIECSKGILSNYDMVVYLGESVHFWKPGWLKRVADVWRKVGVSMLGPFGSHVIRAHLQTTSFITSPKLVASYPIPVTDKESRYAFEHGERALWRLLRAKRYPVYLVTWSGIWPPGQWRFPKAGLWSGSQEDLLWHCIHSDNYAKADAKRKENWNRSANRMFQ